MPVVLSIITGDLPTSFEPLTQFLVQLIIVVIFCRLLSFAISYIKQPPVIAEVLTGILLGPSAFGKIPNFTNSIFPATSINTFNVIANVGLIMFMFVIGLEIDIKLIRRNWKHTASVSIISMIAPFVLGLASSYAIYITSVGPGVSFASFLLFVGVAQAITAFPVLARIITERKLLDTNVGAIALACAAVNDVAAWCLLALVVAIAQAQNAITALYTILVLAGFTIFMFLIVRPLILRIALSRKGASLRLQVVALLLIMMFIFGWFTEIIGVHSIFGSFILGVITPRKKKFAAQITERIEDVVITIFLPLYFTYSGLNTDITTLNDGISWGMVFLVLGTAVIGKFGGACLTSKWLMKMSWRDSITLGILMNTKGLVELIVLNIGLQVGVLNTKTFTIFVLMALFTTVMTTPLVWFIYQRHMKTGVPSSPKHDIELQPGLHIMLHINDPNVSHWLGIVVDLFRPKNEHVHVKALLAKEIDDRPSTYILTKLYERKDDITLLAKKSRTPLYSLKESMESRNASFDSKTLITSSVAYDVCTYIDNSDYDLSIFQLKQDVVVHQALPLLFQKGLKTIEKAFNWDTSNAHTVSYALQNLNNRIAVLVDKTSIPNRIESVLFVYDAQPYESASLEFVLNILKANSQIHVTVATSEADFIIKHGVKSELAKVILTQQDQIDSSNFANEYDIIVIGADRSNRDVFDTEIMQCEVPVLLLYTVQSNTTPMPSSYVFSNV